MSDDTNLTEREMRVAIFKMATLMVVIVAILAVGVTALVGQGNLIAVNFLLISLALTLLANGLLVVLKILDRLEARKRHHG